MKMVLLQQYLQLDDKQRHLLSPAWEILHIFFYVLISVSGAAASFAFRKVLDGFAGYCFLYSHTTFDISVTYLTVDYLKAQWEMKSDCSLCLCASLLSYLWNCMGKFGRVGKPTRG